MLNRALEVVYNYVNGESWTKSLLPGGGSMAANSCILFPFLFKIPRSPPPPRILQAVLMTTACANRPYGDRKRFLKLRSCSCRIPWWSAAYCTSQRRYLVGTASVKTPLGERVRNQLRASLGERGAGNGQRRKVKTQVLQNNSLINNA